MDAKAPPPPPPPVRAATSKPPPPPPLRANPSQKPPPVAPATGKSVAPPPLPSSRPQPTPAPPAALHAAPAPASTVVHDAHVGHPPQATIQRQMRVSVKASVRDPSLIVARPLADGQELPAGTREALLVLVDHPDDPLVGPPTAGASGAE